MACSAVRSLKTTIEDFLCCWIDPSSGEMLKFEYNSTLQFSKRVFTRYRCRRPLRDIEDAVYKLAIALESGGIDNLEEEIHLFTGTMHKLEQKYADELYNSLPGGEEDEDEEEVVSDADRSKMVGFSDHFNHLKHMLWIDTEWRNKLKVVSLCGMPGIGKTTLAREIFEDPDIVERFDCRVWVRVGRKYAAECLEELYSRSFKRSLLLVISRLQQVDNYDVLLEYNKMEMQMMDKEESLVRSGALLNSRHLEGRLQRNVKVFLLSKRDKTADYWNEVATRKKHQG